MGLEYITPETVIEGEKIILTYEGTVLFSSSNMSIINGTKGSMKSSCRDLLLQNLLSPGEGFESNLGGNILVVDTEMSKRLIHNNLNRFSSLDKLYFAKAEDKKSAMDDVERAIDELKPEVLVLDGSRDFVLNSNDPAESMKAINRLMYWTAQYKVHILNIVHSVKTEGGVKTKGTFGSELENKAETIINMSKWGQESRVKCMFSRETLPFNDFKITIDKNGRPIKV